MDYTTDPTTGKLTVTLGGILWDNCTRDVDCPGDAYCFQNATWSAYPSMCACPFGAGKSGALCEGLTVYGLVFYISHVIIALMACVCIALTMRDVYVLWSLKGIKWDAITSSLGLVVCASFWIALQTGGSTIYSTYSQPPDPVTGSKRWTFALTPIALAVSFFFVTLTLMNISLVWIEIAKAARTLSRRESSSVTNYRCFLFVYYAIFFVALVVLLIGGLPEIAAIFGIVGAAIVGITYFYGYFRMRAVLKETLDAATVDGSGSMQQMGTNASAEFAKKRLQESLLLISRAAISISVSIGAIVLFMSLWVISGGFSKNPSENNNMIWVSLLWISVICANIFVVMYLHVTVENKLRHQTQLQTMSDNNRDAIVAAVKPSGDSRVVIANKTTSGNASSSRA